MIKKVIVCMIFRRLHYLPMVKPADSRSFQKAGYDLLTTSGWLTQMVPIFRQHGANAMAMR